MRNYDPNQALVAIHVPKCAGNAFGRALSGWFGERLRRHYMHERAPDSPPHPLDAGTCIYGHFYRPGGNAIETWYPDAAQFSTVLRDPFEAALSLYFFGRRLGHRSSDHYADVNSFLAEHRSILLHHMPDVVTEANYRQMFAERFVHVGIAERLQQCADGFAHALGLPPIEIDTTNTSLRDETISADEKRAFIDRHALEFTVYDYVAGLA